MIYLAGIFVVVVALLFYEHRRSIWELWILWVVWPRTPAVKPKIVKEPRWRWANLTAAPDPGGIYLGSLSISAKKVEQIMFMGRPLWKILGVSPSAHLADLMQRQNLEGDLEFKFRVAGDPKWHMRSLSLDEIARL